MFDEHDDAETDPNVLFGPAPSDEELANYLLYRGQCKPLAEAAVAADPTLTLVRGHYHDPAWGAQAHWWTVRLGGTVYDPTARQFPSQGTGVYVPFTGVLDCDECGVTVKEEDAQIIGNGHYAVCSYECALRFVGLPVPREERTP